MSAYKEGRRAAIQELMPEVNAAVDNLLQQIEDLTRDRDEWKQQHENLLAVRQQDIAALTLATPADAGAGQPNQFTDAATFKNFHRSLCARFGYTHDEQFWWRDLVSLEEHIARLSKPGAQAPMHKDVEWLMQCAEEAQSFPDIATKVRAHCMAAAQRELGQSAAQVTAEPVATYFHKDIDSIADELEAEAMNYEGDFADTVKGCAEALRDIATHSAPADRDAIRDAALEDAAAVCDKSSIQPRLAKMIRALKSMERAADAAETRDAKGGV